MNSVYKCVLNKPKKPAILHSQKVKLKGWSVRIPSRSLFVTKDGSVYVQVQKRGCDVDYASLESLIESVKNTKLIENSSL